MSVLRMIFIDNNDLIINGCNVLEWSSKIAQKNTSFSNDMLPLRYILTPVYKISNFLRTIFGKKYLNYFEHPPSAKNSIAQQILVPMIIYWGM